MAVLLLYNCSQYGYEYDGMIMTKNMNMYMTMNGKQSGSGTINTGRSNQSPDVRTPPPMDDRKRDKGDQPASASSPTEKHTHLVKPIPLHPNFNTNTLHQRHRSNSLPHFIDSAPFTYTYPSGTHSALPFQQPQHDNKNTIHHNTTVYPSSSSSRLQDVNAHSQLYSGDGYMNGDIRHLSRGSSRIEDVSHHTKHNHFHGNNTYSNTSNGSMNQHPYPSRSMNASPLLMLYRDSQPQAHHRTQNLHTLQHPNVSTSNHQSHTLPLRLRPPLYTTSSQQPPNIKNNTRSTTTSINHDDEEEHEKRNTHHTENAVMNGALNHTSGNADKTTEKHDKVAPPPSPETPPYPSSPSSTFSHLIYISSVGRQIRYLYYTLRDSSIVIRTLLIHCVQVIPWITRRFQFLLKLLLYSRHSRNIWFLLSTVGGLFVHHRRRRRVVMNGDVNNSVTGYSNEILKQATALKDNNSNGDDLLSRVQNVNSQSSASPASPPSPSASPSTQYESIITITPGKKRVLLWILSGIAIYYLIKWTYMYIENAKAFSPSKTGETENRKKRDRDGPSNINAGRRSMPDPSSLANDDDVHVYAAQRRGNSRSAASSPFTSHRSYTGTHRANNYTLYNPLFTHTHGLKGASSSALSSMGSHAVPQPILAFPSASQAIPIDYSLASQRLAQIKSRLHVPPPATPTAQPTSSDSPYSDITSSTYQYDHTGAEVKQHDNQHQQALSSDTRPPQQSISPSPSPSMDARESLEDDDEFKTPRSDSRSASSIGNTERARSVSPRNI